MEQILEHAHTQRSSIPLSLDEASPQIQTHKFDEVYGAVEKLDQLRLESPRHVKTLADLTFKGANVVDTPELGELHLTDWAQRRIGGMVGVKWHKFFGPMSGDDVQRAIHAHLNGMGDDLQGIKLVSRELMDHEKERYGTDGLLRGVVSPSYSEFRDLHALDRLYSVAGSLLEEEWAFADVHFLDNSSHFNLIHTEPFPLLDGSNDMAYVGLRLRNSEVGAHSWTGSVCLLRIVCVNGMMAPLAEGHHFRFIHKGLKLELVDESIESAFDQCYFAVEHIPALMGRLLETKLDSPLDHLRMYMERHSVSPVLRRAVLDAYNEQDIEGDNGYRALQALTHLSPALRQDPNRQRDIEELAGKYAEELLS
jgi:hypothetical protein